MVPSHLAPLFWDVDLASFDPLEYPGYAIAHVLEWGDLEAIAWMKATLPESKVTEVLRTDRRLSRRSANFWALVYEIPPEQVAAHQESPRGNGSGAAPGVGVP